MRYTQLNLFVKKIQLGILKAMGLILVFLKQFVVPFIYALGLIFFIYGFIQYFILGRAGDEGRAQVGREFFLRSIIFFCLGLLLYTVVLAMQWLTSFYAAVSTPSGAATPPAGGGGAELRQDSGILVVPDAPQQR